MTDQQIIFQAIDAAIQEMEDAREATREEREELLQHVCGCTVNAHAPIRFFTDGFYWGLAQGLKLSETTPLQNASE